MNFKIFTSETSRYLPIFVLSILIIQGCSGVQTYSNNILAGETAVVAAGWKHYFTQDNVTVTFTPDDDSGGPIDPYLPGDSRIRGIINLYPDPLSSIVLSQQTNNNITGSSLTYSDFVAGFTGGDKESWQTTVYLDTPTDLPVGNTTITITTPEGETAESVVNVTGTGGTADAFHGGGSGPLTRTMFESMERIDHYVISFSGDTVPSAIQVDLTATVLSTFIKGKRGDIATLNWSKSNDDYRVIITPTTQGSITDMSDFSFYVPIASGLEGITTLSMAGPVQAFDSNGNTVSDVITASIVLVRGVGGLYALP